MPVALREDLGDLEGWPVESAGAAAETVPLSGTHGAVHAIGRRWDRIMASTRGRVALAVVAVAVSTGALLLADADLTVAISTLFAVVVFTALLGTPAGITGMVGSYLALNYWFIPPRGSLILNRVDYVAPLLAFAFAAAACGIIVNRLNTMRREAEAHERGCTTPSWRRRSTRPGLRSSRP